MAIVNFTNPYCAMSPRGGQMGHRLEPRGRAEDEQTEECQIPTGVRKGEGASGAVSSRLGALGLCPRSWKSSCSTWPHQVRSLPAACVPLLHSDSPPGSSEHLPRGRSRRSLQALSMASIPMSGTLLGTK